MILDARNVLEIESYNRFPFKKKQKHKCFHAWRNVNPLSALVCVCTRVYRMIKSCVCVYRTGIM